MRKEISEIINKGINEKIFPGAVVGIIKNGHREIFPFGRFTYEDSPEVQINTIYDVASVTKAIPTASLILTFLDQGVVKFDDPVVKFLPEFGNHPGKDQVSIRHLLTYTLDLDMPPMSSLKHLSPDEIMARIISAPSKSKPGAKFLYNNSTALLMGLILKKLTGKMVDKLADEYFFKPLKMERTGFHPLQNFKKEDIAPTEICEWRGREIIGEVHDESSFVLQQKYYFGVAGLFSTAPDLLVFLEMLINNGEKDGKRFFSEKMVDLMSANHLADIGESAGLGWGLNQESFMGKNRTLNTCGKRAFTGPLALWDHSQKSALVFLANRTYPKRPTDNSAINRIRSALADVVLG